MEQVYLLHLCWTSILYLENEFQTQGAPEVPKVTDDSEVSWEKQEKKSQRTRIKIEEDKAKEEPQGEVLKKKNNNKQKKKT